MSGVDEEPPEHVYPFKGAIQSGSQPRESA